MSRTIAASWRESKRSVRVLGRRMAYVERGSGDPVVLLHGNPTSSFLWRTVLPGLTPLGRCIAPDLIGMGDSEKLPADDPARYSLARHGAFLDALLDALDATANVTLVVHDWGSALGFDWARRHPDRMRAIAYMEAIVRPWPTWDAWPARGRQRFLAMRSHAGERLVLEQNMFVERVLPGMSCAPWARTNWPSTAARSARPRTACPPCAGRGSSRSTAGPRRWWRRWRPTRTGCAPGRGCRSCSSTRSRASS
ncbi:haloalkane dehalogenase [Streptomyces sp. NPDC047002]|uniref:haloalkane dehalogenase n=1 Tax=Streptomyces sp. NPDC047002 TaxID=3155475 RepID=UPI003453351A